MRVFGRTGARAMRLATGALLTGAIALGMLSTTAAAQSCGDADGSGSVTVTDGVQVLRSAAGLSSTCTARPTSCDVDGSGTATVSDGVNVLRKAAGLAITESCPGSGGGDTADVAEVTDVLVPFLALGLAEIPNVNVAAAGTVQAADTENCEDGGSRTTDRSGVTITVTFAACKVSESGLGSFQFDGVIRASLGFPTSSVTFDEFLVTDRSNGEVSDFDGTLTGRPRLGGGFVVDGPVSVRGANETEIFRATFTDFTVDGDGHIVSGSVEAEDTSDSFELKRAELEVENGSNTASVHVVRDDDTEKDYQLDLSTGDLTPVD
jgi:hypothetical protein